jgi:5-bromo-4-chloroindolyl phosphate hydrolysis protein
MMNAIRKVVTVAITGLTFSALFIYLKLNIVVVLILCGVVYGSSTLLLKPKTKKLPIENKNATSPQVKAIVRKGKLQVHNIRYEGRKIPNASVKQNVMKICDVADEIFNDFIKAPKDLRDARKFLDYYLETTEKIVFLYSDLSKKTVYTENEQQVLSKAEQILTQIEEVFHQQKGKLQENDYLELSIELDVLEMTIKSEGV